MTRVDVGRTSLAILRGAEDLSQWDEEELMRGQKRDRNGKWVGRPPKLVPKAVHDELVRRKQSEAYQLLTTSLVDAVRVLGEIVRDPEADAGARVRAATVIIERVMGKTPQPIVVAGAESLFEQVARGKVITNRTPPPADDDIIDAEVVDEP